MGALTGEEKERYEQQFVPKLLKPEEADTIKEEEKAPEAEKQGSESIESIQIKNEDLEDVYKRQSFIYMEFKIINLIRTSFQLYS